MRIFNQFPEDASRDQIEKTADRLKKMNGILQSCHPTLSSGGRAFYGMGSPSSRRVNKLVIPYFRAISTRYETVEIGVAGGGLIPGSVASYRTNSGNIIAGS